MHQRDVELTTAEAATGSILGGVAAAIVLPYSTARLGGAILPWTTLTLLIAAAVGAAVLMWLRRGVASRSDLLPWSCLVLGVVAALVWLSWPALLPIGGGSDLTHHLQLVDFIERQWRLPLAPGAERLLGGMVDYTPGFHLLVALVGRWIGRDGFHAVYGVLAFTAAIKASIVFLITRRLVTDERLKTPAALSAALVLFLPFDYFVGPFVRASFFAQSLSEMFAVGMWWALVLWDERPSARAAAIFGVAGIGVFLSWPVWIGPPVIVFIVLLWMKREPDWVRHAALALVPIAAVAVAHALGRVASAAIVQTGGSTFWPTVARFSWPFLLLAGLGFAITARQRRMRVTMLLLAAIGLQALVLLGLATRSGSDTPYMALKMVHLAVYPMALASALAIEAAGAWLARPQVCWAVVVALGAATLRTIAPGPPQAPIVSEDLFLAGRWARAHVPTTCVEYLVPQELTAYWLHHAALGNPSYPPAGARPPVLVYRDAVERWITKTSLPVAIADLRVVPREIREEMDERARFGEVIVGVRRGSTETCGDYATGVSTMRPSNR